MAVARKQQAGSGPGPWCPICGRTVTHIELSLDPAIPIGRCFYRDADGFAHGHGRVAAVTDSETLRASLAEKARLRAWRRHEQHLGAVPVRGCVVCKEQGQGVMSSVGRA